MEPPLPEPDEPEGLELLLAELFEEELFDDELFDDELSDELLEEPDESSGNSAAGSGTTIRRCGKLETSKPLHDCPP